MSVMFSTARVMIFANDLTEGSVQRASINSAQEVRAWIGFFRSWMIEFDMVPVQGGILCTNGKWQAVDGSMSGTTPFRVFIKDGVRRRSP